VSPILLASSSGGALEAAFDDMSLFPLKSWDAEDRVILGCISRLFGFSPLVLGNYSPRHEPWVLIESGSGHKFSGPTSLFGKLSPNCGLFNLIIKKKILWSLFFFFFFFFFYKIEFYSNLI